MRVRMLLAMMLLLFSAWPVGAAEPGRAGGDGNSAATQAYAGPVRADLAGLGLVDVTAAPFRADPTGRKDSTKALQAAIDHARDQQMVCFFPPGTYTVSDTLECAQNAYSPATGQVRWTRNFPCVLMGSHRGPSRPRIVLAPRAPGFGDATKPKCVLHFWARDFVHQKPFNEQDNTSMNQMLVGIDLAVGAGNPGAIVIRHRGAQGSGVQDCAIDVTHGHTGLQGASGSGGSHVNVTVIGGRVGLDLREAQPAPTIAGITLIGQTHRAIIYDGSQALSAVGLRIETAQVGPLIEGLGGDGVDAANGAISLVDATLVFENARPENVAIRMARGLTMNNVFIRGASRVVQFGDGTILPGSAGGWLHVAEYAHGVRPPVYRETGNDWKFQFEAPIYLDGDRRTADVAHVAQDVAAPEDIQTRHVWDTDFPSWETPGAVNVKQAPYLARGDSTADDTVAIQRAIDEHEVVFLPKGAYRITHPLVLKPRTRLVGLARHLSLLAADPAPSGGFHNPDRPQPLIRTCDDSEASTVLAFLGLVVPADAPGAYALEWQCGRRSIYRAVNIERKNREDVAAGGPSKKPRNGSQAGQDHPFARITGHGGGRWYEFIQGTGYLQGQNYRHLLIQGTTQPLRFYQCNPEHAGSEANIEISHARHVVMYGVKSEGNAPVLWVKDSDDISLIGYGGNASAREGQALFVIERTSNFMFANLWQKPRTDFDRRNYFAGRAVDPREWSMLRESPSVGVQILTRPLERPVLYRRGHPPMLDQGGGKE